MSDLRYAIQIPVPGIGQYTICQCDTAERACEVVRMLLSQRVASYYYVAVVIKEPFEDKGADNASQA